VTGRTKTEVRDKLKRLQAEADVGLKTSASYTLSKAVAAALLAAAKADHRLGAYVILSLTTGIRTEEARALRWDHVDLDGDPSARPPVPPPVAVWRSVRAHGDTKTERSRRTLALPQSAVAALKEQRRWQAEARQAARAALARRCAGVHHQRGHAPGCLSRPP
jgi:integrase